MHRLAAGGRAVVPLTASQQLIWLRQRLAPAEPLYDAACTFELFGELDEEAFVRAFARLVQGTDAMRFVMREDGGEPVATVLDEGGRGCDRVDLSNAPEHFDAWLDERMRHPPDPTRCLYDAAIIKLAPDRYCWFLSVHHLITDGWNLTLLFRRQEACYRAVRTGASVGPFPRFVDHIASEHAYRNSSVFARHAAWWEARSVSAHANSRFYAARASDPNPRHTRLVVSLGRDRSRALRDLAGSPAFRGLTPELGLFHVFVVALLAWYWRITNEGSICLGVTSHGRAKAVSRETAGLFMQQLPFRADVERADSFATLAKRVARAALEFFGHAVPGSVSPRAQKTFDVTFNYIPATFGTFDGRVSRMTWRHNGYGDPERRLGVTVHDFNATGQFEILLDLSDAAFTAPARDATIRHLLATLDAMGANPTTAVARYPLLSREEQEASLRRLDSGSTTLRSTPDVWSAFERIADRAPRHLAVTGSGCALSYAGLAQRASQLAVRLREVGVRAADIVALASSRRAEAVPAMLGILKAGAAFLPIDPGLPEERRAWLMEDSGASFVVRVGEDVDLIEAAKGPAQPPRGADRADPPAAYLLYTSGSTGRPNGVLVGHASVLNLLEACETLVPIPAGGRCSWWTNVGFDVAIYEVFSSVLFGRTLVVPDESTRLSPVAMFEWLASEGISGAYLPPFYLADFDRWLDTHDKPPLRRLLVGVEPIPQKRLASIGGKLPGLGLLNGYGPTEATVCATLHLVDLDDHDAGPTPIGRPVPRSRCYLLDPNENAVPDGVVGELYIGGASLALGYYRRDQLNRERFVVDPLGLSEDWFFRTGDGARLREDGRLEFCGRLDRQIKLKGERIEPTEVMHAILDYPGVSACHVIASDAGRQAGDRRLVGYYVSDEAIDRSALRAHLRRRLPPTLVPATLVAVDAIPRNINGKPDETRLPVPVSESLVGPPDADDLTEAEARITTIWCEELDIERIRPSDAFTDLGGDSLMAVRIVARVNRAFGVQLPFVNVFETETIAELARLVEQTLIDEIEQVSDVAAQRISTRDLGS